MLVYTGEAKEGEKSTVQYAAQQGAVMGGRDVVVTARGCCCAAIVNTNR
jgi:hypothetical protein